MNSDKLYKFYKLHKLYKRYRDESDDRVKADIWKAINKIKKQLAQLFTSLSKVVKMLSRILESIFTKLGESFLSKVVEQTADNAQHNVKSIKDFELILKAQQKKLKSLCAKASDVEEEIKNSELSGRKKRGK
ncbi:hypothetical protein SASPL_148283 [Salvia splendens]|uniref:Uncharacterized protein n=1 Tax=Salvia splendens TaxID=180675 RepID=A0A8X8W9J8_SALSN|nr:hypothetical protein SASPL_148283 [Salvia splendens]